MITGAGSGIGRSAAELFVRHGARVIAVDLSAAHVEETASAIRRAGGVCLPFESDVADEAAPEQIVAAVDWGVDVLLTSAAISVGGTVATTSAAQWDRVLRVNVFGVANWVSAVLPSMIGRGRGSIITVASQLAFAGARSSASYAASKGAVISLTQAIALDHAAQGIRANALVPGAIETPFLTRALDRSTAPDATATAMKARYPMGRFGTSIEVAEAALFLASDASSFVTGVALPVDGGRLVD